MGQQQILLIVLSVILVGIAIAVGITMFQAQAEQSNIDAIISDLNNLGSQAYQYYIRPTSMGGGSQSYENFSAYFITLPANMLENENAIYRATPTTAATTSVVIMARSKFDDTVLRSVTVANDGTMTIQTTVADATWNAGLPANAAHDI